MALSYIEKQEFNQFILTNLKLKLTNKPADGLPSGGVSISNPFPENQCLLGSLGFQRDAVSKGLQSPHSMGMVLLVKPNEDGLLCVDINGQADLLYRCIPSFEEQSRALVEVDGAPKQKQNLTSCFQRMMLAFSGGRFEIDTAKDENTWVSDKREAIQSALRNLESELHANPRIFKKCHLTPRGYAKTEVQWDDALIHDQSSMEQQVIKQLFSDTSQIFHYDIGLTARCRKAPLSLARRDGLFLLEVYMVNRARAEDAIMYGINRPTIMDCGLTVSLTQGISYKLPHKLNPEDYRFFDEEGLDGYGINCGVDVFKPNVFHTNSLPTYHQPYFETPDALQVGMSASPTYELLSKNPLPVLEDLVSALTGYSDDWLEKIQHLRNLGDNKAADEAKLDSETFISEMSRIADGISLLKSKPDLLRSFMLMNETMARAVKIQGKSFDGWRLFQLAFILTQIKSIQERLVKVDDNPSFDVADVLWFATGGGKTEAYLGVITIALFYQRITNRLYGTSSWMRFPLRMLASQQFQRLSYVIAQANIIKERENIQGFPFTIGYFTGAGTPNSLSKKDSAGNNVALGLMSPEDLLKFKFINDCPYCGGAESVFIEKNNACSRIYHRCLHSTCWSNTVAKEGSHGEGIKGEIGIFVSDEECYRYLPSVLVGTIDKLAIVALNRKFNLFFGTAKYFCPEHGFTRQTQCEHNRWTLDDKGFWDVAKCGNNTSRSHLRVVNIPSMRDPGFPFLIQDELHLLSENLGNFDGHYESLLCVMQKSFGGVAPKILAATATIKDFEHHVHHLYLKRGRRFPAPGIVSGESFYSRRRIDPDTGDNLIRRTFAACLPIMSGKSAPLASATISFCFMAMMREWRNWIIEGDTAFLKPLRWATSKLSDLVAHIETNLDSNLIYVTQKGLISEIANHSEQVNASLPDEQRFRSIRLDADTPLETIQREITHIENKPFDDNRKQLVATNLISHGVDLERLNFMTLCGWPTSTAEYVQATARAGRVHPGIIITTLGYHKLYEQNIFLNFRDYHFFMEKLVESVPINRFAYNILDRTLPGIMCAIILNWAAQQSWGAKISYGFKQLHELLNQSDINAIGMLKNKIMETLSVHDSPVASYFDSRVLSEFESKLGNSVSDALSRMEQLGQSSMDMTIPEVVELVLGHRPFTSFRDIEPAIGIKFESQEEESILDALRR